MADINCQNPGSALGWLLGLVRIGIRYRRKTIHRRRADSYRASRANSLGSGVDDVKMGKTGRHDFDNFRNNHFDTLPDDIPQHAAQHHILRASHYGLAADCGGDSAVG